VRRHTKDNMTRHPGYIEGYWTTPLLIEQFLAELDK
jgi:hypothetical protein